MPVALEIVSPERLLLSRPVDMVVLPASEGDMGVLVGHAPMIVTLRGGTISLYENNVVTDRLYVAGGFAEVTPERCTILATEVVPVTEVSRATAEKRMAEAEAAYAACGQERRGDPGPDDGPDPVRPRDDRGRWRRLTALPDAPACRNALQPRTRTPCPGLFHLGYSITSSRQYR